MTLSFRIAGTPVQILPSFFLMTVLLNANTRLSELVAWVAVVLVSVTVHELGHAFAGTAFGVKPRIVLHGFGGTTSWGPEAALSTTQRIVISLAGPAAGLALAGVVAWVLGPRAFPGSIGSFVYRSLLWVNFGWGILNLLPMLPLDGGAVMARLLDRITEGRGERPARVASIAVACAAGLFALYERSLWSAFLAASFVASNAQALRALGAGPAPPNPA